MKRRDFLQMSLMLGAGSFISSGVLNKLSAQTTSSGGKRILLVFLRGGADVISLFPPRDLSKITPYRDRKLILDEGKYVGGNLSIPYYLHPEFAPVIPLFLKGQVALIPHTASLNKTRSHFVQQDLIESGSHLSVRAQGILGGTARILGEGKRIVSMGNYLPHSYKGADPVLINNVLDIRGQVTATGVKSGLSRDERLSLLKSSSTCATHDKLCQRVQSAREGYSQLEHDAGAAQAPAGAAFIQHMDLAGQIISSPYAPSLISVDMGSWDSHFGSLAEGSKMANNFRDLAAGIMAFRARLSDQEWDNTVVMVISEFGRTIRSNPDLGTDHGAGSMMMLLGGKVNPSFQGHQSGWDLSRFEDSSGEVAAAEAGSSAALLRKIDYRLILSEVLQKQFGISVASQRESIFEGYGGGDFLNVLKSS